ncbi:hypothetical protein Tco_0209368 [Tanacetum coccineum]
MMVQQAVNQVKETLLVIVVEQLVVDMNVVDEPLVLNGPLVLDEKLALSMIVDELMLHMVVVVEEMCKITKELVKAVGDTMMNCIKVDDCCSMEVYYRN